MADWREPRPAPGGSPRLAGRGKLLALLAALLALAGVVAALVARLRRLPEPGVLVLGVSQYVDPRVPVNPWADQDRRALLPVFRRKQNAFVDQTWARMEDDLRGLKGWADKSVVVYLSAFALVGDDGQVYLLPADARVSDPDSWLLLEKVFHALRDCRAAHKLLLLDIVRPFPQPRAGVLADDVAAEVRSALDAAVQKDPHLTALCACSPGQVGLGSEGLRRSAFGYYLEQGLLGHADGHGGGRRDGRVSARELAAFVEARVDRWARRNRGERQTPVLVAGASAQDFPLVGVAGDNGRAPRKPPDDEPYPDWLRDGWALRDRWRVGAARASVPACRELDEALLHAERHWRGGTAAAASKTFTEAAAARFRREHDRLVEGTKTPPRSLAEAAARGMPGLAADDALAKELADLDVRVRGFKGKEKDELAAARDQFLKKEAFQKEPSRLFWAVLEAACAEPSPRPEQILFWNDLLARGRKALRAVPPYAEAQYLEGLAALAEKAQKAKKPAGGAGEWPAEAVRLALLTAREEQRVAAGDPRARPWVEGLRAEAARKQRQAEKALRAPAPGPGKAAELFQRSLQGYQTAWGHLQTVQDALRCRDEALALLPGYVPYLDHDPDQGPTWVQAAEAAQSLRDVLALPPADRFDKIKSLTEELQAALRELRRPFEPGGVKKLIGQAEGGGPSDWRKMNALLSCSWLEAKGRKELWEACRDLSRHLHQKTEAGDQADRRAGAPPAFDSGKAGRLGRESAFRQAEWSLALLKLEGAADVKQLGKALARAREAPEDPAAWQALRRELRQAWAPR